MTWDPRDKPFDRLSIREQADALWTLATNRRKEAAENRRAGFRQIADVQVEQAQAIETRARALELEIRGK